MGDNSARRGARGARGRPRPKGFTGSRAKESTALEEPANRNHAQNTPLAAIAHALNSPSVSDEPCDETGHFN
ncbi:hypothetical protein EVAR_89116_1 [Eumeta japonica]|uniref:Uncharacterized protein n=1 Tax=Eumeta variegata TaxID=151549 RepID=A0A4C1ZNR2_EUMVA|nr:hypothetical protein EVAR_89116_1 [Eumeta japonica]